MGLHPGEVSGGVLGTGSRFDLSAEDSAALETLEARIGIQFRHPALLREAMTHASWNNERGEVSGPGRDNERLEYLGDAVLELVIGEYLFRRFPEYDEGQLTQLRAALVNTTSLARLAEGLALGEALLLGRGAVKSGARQLPSLLANSFEALVGALFLDQGYRVTTRFVLQNIGDLAQWTDENFKGQLQEIAQEKLGETPSYRVVQVGGPGHRREYHAEVLVGGRLFGEGDGHTKQSAQQAAAKAAIASIQGTTDSAAQLADMAKTAANRLRDEPPRFRRRAAEAAAEATVAHPQPQERRPVVGSSRPRIFEAIRNLAAAIMPSAPAPPPPPPAAARKHRGRRGGRKRTRSPKEI